jgi:hypothetical protein
MVELPGEIDMEPGRWKDRETQIVSGQFWEYQPSTCSGSLENTDSSRLYS